VFTAKILHYFDRSCSVQHDSAITSKKVLTRISRFFLWCLQL